VCVAVSERQSLLLILVLERREAPVGRGEGVERVAFLRGVFSDEDGRVADVPPEEEEERGDFDVADRGRGD
jgi:anti-sigma factor ChrR (cupin superfamily)